LLNVVQSAPRIGLGLWIACILAMSVEVAVAAESPEPKPPAERKVAPQTWYVSAVVSGRSGYRLTHYWSKGASLRAQTMVGIHPVTTIVRGDRYWVYDPIMKEGIEIQRSARAIAEDAKQRRPFGNDLESLIRSDGEKVDTEILSGVPVETWRVTNDTGRRTVWVTVTEPIIVLRVENFDRESGESASLSYSNWASNFDLPDTAFEPPADLRIQKFEYDEYVEKSLSGLVGPVPVLYPKLLHGPQPE
jgi:outer membrane lipoprotein-sorting protein